MYRVREIKSPITNIEVAENGDAIGRHRFHRLCPEQREGSEYVKYFMRTFGTRSGPHQDHLVKASN